MLEFSLIQRHRPRFNVRYTDDKSYPFLCVTMLDEWPRAMVMRGRRRKGNRYFGPYGHAYAIRDTLDLLLRTFPIRTCTDGKFRRYASLGKPCLLYHIEKCSGPCVGNVSADDYAEMVADLLEFLEGDIDPVIDRLSAEMAAAADELEYERAARLRDRLDSVRKAVETQQMGRLPQRGLRRHRAGGGRSGGRRSGVLRAPGPGDGAAGLHDRQGRGARPGRAGEPGAGAPLLRRQPAGVAQAGAGARHAGRGRAVHRVADGDARFPGPHQGAPARPQAGPASHRDPQRRGVLHPPPAQAQHRPQQPGPGPQRAPAASAAGRGPAAHSSATT